MYTGVGVTKQRSINIASLFNKQKVTNKKKGHILFLVGIFLVLSDLPHTFIYFFIAFKDLNKKFLFCIMYTQTLRSRVIKVSIS